MLFSKGSYARAEALVDTVAAQTPLRASWGEFFRARGFLVQNRDRVVFLSRFRDPAHICPWGHVSAPNSFRYSAMLASCASLNPWFHGTSVNQLMMLRASCASATYPGGLFWFVRIN